MRVISGTARRIPLKCMEGFNTRPTTDRIKETLFNMIAPYLYDCRFLDLFAGSGAIGIEALSRGAKEAVFVEADRRAMDCIRYNLEKTSLTSKAMTLHSDVVTALYRLEGEKSFDYIFMDPPYGKGLERKVLEYLKDSELLAPGGILIVEASLDETFEDVEKMGYILLKTKRYKTNQHVFLEPQGRKEIC